MNGAKKPITIYLMCRDRPGYFSEVVESILSSCADIGELVISDNSVGDEIQMLSKKYAGRARYIKRGNLDSGKHFETVFGEVTAEFFVVFHDDDVMLEGYVQRMYDQIKGDLNCAALGCNAYVYGNNSKLYSTHKSDRIENQAKLLRGYFGIKTSCPPFPSYMYRSSLVKGLANDNSEAGKYSDVTFLCKVLERGCIRWVSEPNMIYRFHNNNDSRKSDLGSKFKLVKHCIKNKWLPLTGYFSAGVYLLKGFVGHFAGI